MRRSSRLALAAIGFALLPALATAQPHYPRVVELGENSIIDDGPGPLGDSVGGGGAVVSGSGAETAVLHLDLRYAQGPSVGVVPVPVGSGKSAMTVWVPAAPGLLQQVRTACCPRRWGPADRFEALLADRALAGLVSTKAAKGAYERLPLPQDPNSSGRHRIWRERGRGPSTRSPEPISRISEHGNEQFKRASRRIVVAPGLKASPWRTRHHARSYDPMPGRSVGRGGALPVAARRDHLLRLRRQPSGECEHGVAILEGAASHHHRREPPSVTCRWTPS